MAGKNYRGVVSSSMEEAVVERHPLFGRIHHWCHALLMLLLGLTGWQIYSGIPIFGCFEVARAIHMLAAITIAIWDLPVQFSYLAITGELRDVLPSKDDIRFQMAAIMNFARMSRVYPAYSIYDPKYGRYFRKYNAGQKLLFWLDIIALLIIGVTGLAMYLPSIFSPLIEAFWWIGGLAFMRAVHYFILWYFIATTAAHIYLGAIPVNWEHFKSIFTGKCREEAKPGITKAIAEMEAITAKRK